MSLTERLRYFFQAKSGNRSRICPGLPEKCVIWASEYNLGPQIWGRGGAQAPAPPDPLLPKAICFSSQSVACFTKVLTTLRSLVNWFHHPLVLEGGEFLFQETFSAGSAGWLISHPLRVVKLTSSLFHEGFNHPT